MSRLVMVPMNRRRKEKKANPKSTSRRQCTIHYTVPGEEGLLQVCKGTCMGLFSLSNSRLQLPTEHVKKRRHIIRQSKWKESEIA